MAKRSTTVRPAKQRVRLAGAEGGTRGDQEGQEAVRHPPTAALTHQLRSDPPTARRRRGNA